MNSQAFLEAYRQNEEQVRLFEYQNSRVLPRPKTKPLSVILLAILHTLIIAIFIVLNVKISVPYYYEIPVSILSYWLATEILFRLIGIKIVECYQHYAKEETRRRCLCVPSCSEYSIACLKKYLLIKALLKIRKRLLITCRGKLYIIDPP
ncbi:MAG: membrane protein insertion efficiency factor YidD [Clostridia bacterium]|nr:membrane protein insertion efficiency factor YidD [Clostridia bacterium]